MSNDNSLVLQVWEVFRDLIKEKSREEAALRMLRQFEEYGFDITSGELEGEDDYLDAALESLNSDHVDDHEEDFAEQDY